MIPASPTPCNGKAGLEDRNLVFIIAAWKMFQIAGVYIFTAVVVYCVGGNTIAFHNAYFQKKYKNTQPLTFPMHYMPPPQIGDPYRKEYCPP